MDDDLEILKNALIKAERNAALDATHRLLDSGTDPKVILEGSMARAMFELGEMWKRGEVFLPEVVASAAIFKQCNELVEPALLARRKDGDDRGHIVLLATVKGDLHDLGKNMVAAMLRTSGFEVTDLGKDVSAATIVAKIRELDPHIIGLSALLTTTVPYQETVIRVLEREGLRDAVKVMVGGAPVTEKFAKEIGADGYSPDASRAVDVAKTFV